MKNNTGPAKRNFIGAATTIALSTLLLVGPASSQPPSSAQKITIDDISKVLTELDYKPTVNGSYVYFTDARNYYYLFGVYGDSTLTGSLVLPYIDASKVQKEPLRDALIWNETHLVFLSLRVNNKGEGFEIDSSNTVDHLTPGNLAKAISELQSTADATRKIWDSGEWK
ncbi:MAG: hypothetical protein P4L73_07090 [Caulobacteraceae bacterium]|nr:hypothetical protein [Caulobacteraceae bacterium]